MTRRKRRPDEAPPGDEREAGGGTAGEDADDEPEVVDELDFDEPRIPEDEDALGDEP